MIKPIRFLAALQAFVLLSFGLHAQSVPTDNPVAKYFYGGQSNSYGWTDQINWGRVINMKTYSNGSNDFQKFENARDEVYAQGGGVLYYPGGNYDFSDAPADGADGRGLMLKSGVVIRGEEPTTDKDAKDGTLALPTKFLFKFNKRTTVDGTQGDVPRDWNFIGMVPSGTEQLKDINNIGILWVHMVGATIYWGPQIKWGPTWTSAASWYSANAKPSWGGRKPDGTHPIDPFAGGQGTRAGGQGATYEGVGSGRLVLGCILQDAAVINNGLDFSGTDDNFYYMYKFGPRIGAYGRNVLIANNVLPKSNKNFKYSQVTCVTIQNANCARRCSSTPETIVLFDYGKTCGIDVNKELLGLVGFNTDGYFETGVEIIGNYVYNHGHKGYNVSGKWVTIRDNVNERNFLASGNDVYNLGGDPWKLTQDGYVQSTPGGDGCISDNLARAFDLGGQALWIDNNTFTNTGSAPGNDGEGILCQLHGGTHMYSWSLTNNKYEPRSGEDFRGGAFGGWDVEAPGSFMMGNVNNVGGVGHMSGGLVTDAAWVNNTGKLDVKFSKVSVSDLITECPTGKVDAPVNVTAKYMADQSFEITWEDNTDQEVAYKIMRKVEDGNWETICYRPRQNVQTNRNDPAWRDYGAPMNKKIYYKVVAINCSNGVEPSAKPDPEFLVSVAKAVKDQKSYVLDPVRPNPANAAASLQFSVQNTQAVNLYLYDVLGNKVANLFSGVAEAGALKTVNIQTANLTAGVYFVRLEGKGFSATQRFVVAK